MIACCRRSFVNFHRKVALNRPNSLNAGKYLFEVYFELIAVNFHHHNLDWIILPVPRNHHRPNFHRRHYFVVAAFADVVFADIVADVVVLVLVPVVVLTSALYLAYYLPLALAHRRRHPSLEYDC